jgi:hypothetical protein
LASGKLNGQKAFMQGKVSAWSWNCDLWGHVMCAN